MSIQKRFEENPELMLVHMHKMQMYLEALEKAAKSWAEANGEFVSATVKYQKRTRKTVKLDAEKAKDLLASQGVNINDIAEVALTEESIKAKLGEADGNRVISELVSAGAIKTHETKYWRLQVK